MCHAGAYRIDHSVWWGWVDARGLEDWETANGWFLCDGRERDKGLYRDLFNAIGTAWGGDEKGNFRLPNLQGYFLRGVDPSRDDQRVDKDSDARFALYPGGNTKATVGSFQGFATARPVPGLFSEPNTSFRTNQAGEHTHKLQFELNAGRDVDDQDNTVAYPGLETDEPVRLAGTHEHIIIEGGNKETRPVNAYVHWIIRYR